MSVFKVFVINLDKSVARLERLKAEFERIGLDFERLPAVDGRKLSDNQILKHYSPELNRKKYFVPLSKPEIGVYISHLKACEKIISENLDFGIILEDDIVLKEGFQIVPQVLSSLKHKWNYIKLIAPGKKKKINGQDCHYRNYRNLCTDHDHSVFVDAFRIHEASSGRNGASNQMDSGIFLSGQLYRSLEYRRTSQDGLSFRIVLF